MLTLEYQTLLPGTRHQVGPAPYFRVEADSLLAGPDDQAVAHYRSGQWQLAPGFATTLITTSPSVVSFHNGHGETCSGPHGPFPRAGLVDGALWYGPHLSRLLARYDSGHQTWHVYPDGCDCKSAVLEEAA
jgi:hypothetical protein